MADFWTTEPEEKSIENVEGTGPALCQVDANIFSNRLDKSAAMRELVNKTTRSFFFFFFRFSSPLAVKQTVKIKANDGSVGNAR